MADVKYALLDTDFNFDDKNEWPAQFDWIMDSLLRIKKAFKKHI